MLFDTHKSPPNSPPPSLADLDTAHISDQPPFVLVDGSYYLFRCFYGVPALFTQDKLPTNAIRGFLNALSRLISTHNPTYMAVAFDTKAPTFRHQMSDQYKAARKPMDDALRVQIPYIHQLIRALGIAVFAIDGYEADDIIGTLAYKACQSGYPVLISTGDKDMAQLVNARVTLENSFDGISTDQAGVWEKFGVYPNQIVDYLTLMGDASDGILGVPKIGAKTAAKLLQEHQNLDTIIQNASAIGGIIGKNILESQDQIAQDKTLATIITDLPLDFDLDALRLHQNRDPKALLDLYQTLEFKKEYKQLQAELGTDDSAQTTDDPSHYQCITCPKTLDALMDTLQNTQKFALQLYATSPNWQEAALAGISITHQADRAYYIAFLYPDDIQAQKDKPLTAAYALHKLAPLLQNPDITKITHDLKHQNHLLSSHKITLQGAVDTMLASYCFNTTATRHALEQLAFLYLGETLPTQEDIAGKGKKQQSPDQIALPIMQQYACQQADVLLRLYDVFENKLQQDDTAYRIFTQLELPIAQILTHMEQAGIRIHRKFLAELSAQFAKDIQVLENKAFAIADTPFNIKSPKQLGVILFEHLKIPSGKKTKTGQYSTSEEVLAQIDHPLVDIVLEHRSLSKLKSTYTDALAQAADKTGRVHTHYHQALTSTGRLSSSDPNLQNIPIRTDVGRNIRKAFVAPEGRVIVAADYSQIELRLMAHFSGDPNLIHAFTHGLDIHKKTASEIFKKDLDQVTAAERRAAKAVNFGLLYGMSPFGLAKQLGVSGYEATRYMDDYFSSYPAVLQYMQSTKDSAIQNSYVETILGRKLFMPDLHSKNYLAKEAALRAAINAPLQGSAADIIKLAMIAVDAVLPKDKARLLLQVHDELIFEVDEQSAQNISQTIATAMQDALSHTAKTLGFAVSFTVPLVVDVGIGQNWEEAH